MNGAESFFSRLRRSEVGHHYHVVGVDLARYAQESAWRERATAARATGHRRRRWWPWRWRRDRAWISAGIGSGQFIEVEKHRDMHKPCTPRISAMYMCGCTMLVPRATFCISYAERSDELAR